MYTIGIIYEVTTRVGSSYPRLNENRWLVRSIAWVPVFEAVDQTTTQGLD